MARPPDTEGINPDTIEELLELLAKRAGLPAQDDRNPLLLRIGDDWRDYSFGWQAFRDLAERLDVPDGSIPIVVVSDGTRERVVESGPPAREEIHTGSSLPASEIAEMWVRALLGQGVPPPTDSAAWFLDDLGIDPGDLSDEVREFLRVETRAKPPVSSQSDWPAFSPSVRSVQRQLGDRKSSAFDIAQAIQSAHGEYAGSRLGGVELEAPSDARMEDWATWSDSVVRLFDEASVRSSKHAVIDARLFLMGVGLLDAPLRDFMESARLWAPLLLEIDETVATAGSEVRGALDAIKLAHGYLSDTVGGVDQLGITGEVNALCEVVTDPGVTPPLAVGLFGSWGSGKTFFMDKMRNRIDQLAARPEREQNIVQIRFNAWHYTDSNLWASIAVEIFERLLDPEPVPVAKRTDWLRDHGDENRKRRERLLEQLETYREAKAALDAERVRLERERSKLEAKKDAIVEARRAAVDGASLTDVAEAVAHDAGVQRAVADVTNTLGLTPAVDELSGLASELRTTGGYAANVWRLVGNKTLALALLALAGILMLAATAMLIGDARWLETAVAGVGSVASIVVMSSRLLRPAVEQVNSGLAAVEAALQKARDAEATHRATRTKEEIALDLVLAEHHEQLAGVSRGLAELDDKIAETAAAAEQLTVGRRLYDFLAERAAAYRQYQGLIGMLHRDFRRLDALLRAQEGDVPRRSPDGVDPIDLVVLYIDDLDRCRPDKVLEVLEAVHLLLALPLFTVVVGVDPRWLKRSLQHQYRSLAPGDRPESDSYLETMPTEYLEKIFQIPLTLPAMEAASYERLIASLAPDAAADVSRGGGPQPRTKRSVAADSNGGGRVPTRALLTVQPGSAASLVGARGIDLTPSEVAFAQQLHGLVGTPRAAKRLMNTYRFVRATQHVGSRSRFLGTDGRPGEYYAVLSLLAVAAGYPSMADRVLVALEQDAVDQDVGSWSEFVQGLALPDGTLVPPDVRRDLAKVPSATAVIGWTNLSTGLAECLAENELDDLAPYREWGPVVARFSFTVG